MVHRPCLLVRHRRLLPAARSAVERGGIPAARHRARRGQDHGHRRSSRRASGYRSLHRRGRHLDVRVWRSPASNSHFWLDVNLSSNQIAVFVVAAIVAVALWYILRHTRLGLQMRAVVDRPDLANLRGVDDGRTSAVAWVMGTVLAGLAGVVGAPVLNSLEINNYNLVMFIAAAAVVLGGLRSVPLAFGGGLFLGVVQNLVGKYAKDWLPFAKNIPGFQNSVPFVLLLVGLLLIARDRNRRSGNVVTQPPPVDWADDLPRWRVQLPWAVAVAVFFVFAMFIVNDVWIGLFANGLAFAVVFMSFVIVTGQGGMVSLAQAAFVMVAAFMTGRFMIEYNWPWILALVVGMLVAMVLGMIVSLPALRLGGLPLALATLALGFLGDEVLFKWNWLRHSQSGWDYRAKTPKLFGINFRHEKPALIALMIIVGLLTVFVHNLHKSASGRAITAVRNSEPAAATSGLSNPQWRHRRRDVPHANRSRLARLGGAVRYTQAAGRDPRWPRHRDVGADLHAWLSPRLPAVVLALGRSRLEYCDLRPERAVRHRRHPTRAPARWRPCDHGEAEPGQAR
ncbi:MAG: hypothetical protein E6G39_01035 [Actinobacteria bacterium]|nr:MAG: hypothetical protein E6G39_01035 [Actinomycetota bacterium]